MKKLFSIILLSILVAFGASAEAAPTNVAFGASVTLNGSFFTGGWGGGVAGTPQSLVDNWFFAQGSQWDQGTVWWDAGQAGGAPQNVVINLLGTYSIVGFIVQADDNDAYLLEYWDIGSSSWLPAWYVPNYDLYNGEDFWGLQTRPNPYNNSYLYTLPASIVTNQLRISGVLSDSDGKFALSEVQAYGYAYVPEPSVLLLLGAGILALAIASRKRSSR